MDNTDYEALGNEREELVYGIPMESEKRSTDDNSSQTYEDKSRADSLRSLWLHPLDQSKCFDTTVYSIIESNVTLPSVNEPIVDFPDTCVPLFQASSVIMPSVVVGMGDEIDLKRDQSISDYFMGSCSEILTPLPEQSELKQEDVPSLQIDQEDGSWLTQQLVNLTHREIWENENPIFIINKDSQLIVKNNNAVKFMKNNDYFSIVNDKIICNNISSNKSMDKIFEYVKKSDKNAFIRIESPSTGSSIVSSIKLIKEISEESISPHNLYLKFTIHEKKLADYKKVINLCDALDISGKKAEILYQSINGLSAAIIAENLNLSRVYVRKILSSIYKELDVSDQLSLNALVTSYIRD